MATFVLRAADRYVGVQRVLIVLAEHLQRTLLTVQFEEVRETDEPGIVDVELRDELGQLDLTLFDSNSLQSRIEVVDADEFVAVVVQILEGFDAVIDVFFG